MSAKDKKIALTITANTRQLRRDMRRAGAEVKGFERQVTGLGAKMRSIRMRFQQTGIFGRGGGALRTAAGFAGVFGIQQMFAGAKEENAALTDIAITGNLTNKQLQKLRKTMYEVSNATAKSTGELTSFVSTVTTMTGDAKGASEALGQIGEIMVATGASGEALAGTYVKLTTTMGLLPKQTKEAFNVLRSQEKLGSVTMANIAANFGKIVGAGGVFGAEGKGIKGVRTMGGLFQIAQRGFAVGQEGEAATSAAAFLRFTGQRAKRIKKTFGVDIFDKSGKARDLPTVLEEMGKAFNVKGEAFRTKGALIFGRSGIRTAQQLALAAAGPQGFGGTQGSFASANALLRTAGASDVIGSDAARRRKSAAYQFDEQTNILKNALKQHAIPLFKQLAKTLKEFGPDLVKVMKFILENSRGLLKLWLGYKGVTFFKNLMAPIQGGAGGGMGQAVAGMARGVGGGGAAIMGPGGQVVPVGAGGRIGAYGRGYGFATGGARRGGWVQGGGRSGAAYYSPTAYAGGTLAGMGGPMVAAGGAWGSRSGRNVGTGWRQRMAGMGRGVRGWGMRNAAGIRSGAGMAGMGMGGAGMMGLLPSYGPGWADMAANMALMSGNPYAMGAGATYKAGAVGIHHIKKPGGLGDITEAEIKKGGILGKILTPFKQVGSPDVSLGKAIAKALKDELNRGSAAYSGARMAYMRDTWRGQEQKKKGDALIAKFGGYTESTGGIFGALALAGGEGQLGISPEQRQALYRKHGGNKAAGLKAMQNRIGATRDRERILAIRSLKPGQELTQENLERANPQYAKLNQLYKALDRLIQDILSGKKITVNAIIPNGSTPGTRAEANNSAGHLIGSQEYMDE